MASLWSRLTRRSKRDMGTNIVADQNALADYFTFNGSAYPIGGFGGIYPFVTYDYNGRQREETIPNDFEGYVNNAYKSNGVVFAVCMVRQHIFSEARFALQGFNGERPGDLVRRGNTLKLLETPWPNGTTGELLARAIQDIDLCGNHYVVREDGPRGPRLRRLRPDWVSIILTKDPTEALKSDIQGYIYKPGNTEDPSKWELFPIDGSNGIIAHWSPTPDPAAQYRGMSWLTPVIKEIIADESVSTYKVNYFNNSATPNLAVSFDPSVTREQFIEFMEVMNQTKHGVGHAGETLYLGGGANVEAIGAKIHEIDFSKLTSITELRICAAARVPPTVVGLTEGMRGSALNQGNFDAAKEMLANATMRPLWRSLCAAYSVLIDVPPRMRLWYDDRDIQFLRDDRQKLAELQHTEASTIARLVQDGFTPESAVLAVIQQDWRLLEHTGLYSVQLLPPNISHTLGGLPQADDPLAKAPAPKTDPAQTQQQPGGYSPSSRPPPSDSGGD